MNLEQKTKERLKPLEEEYVYLLVNDSNSAFKIGKAVNVQNRMASLPQDFDLERSLYLTCKKGDSFMIEKTLHRMFRHDNIEIPRCDGSTEWFSIDCFDEVVTFVQSQQVRLGVISLQPVPKVIAPPKATKPCTIVPRRRLTTEEFDAVLVKSDEDNLATVEKFSSMFKDLVASDCFIGLAVSDSTRMLVVKGKMTNFMDFVRENLHWDYSPGTAMYSIISGSSYEGSVHDSSDGYTLLTLGAAFDTTRDVFCQMSSVKTIRALIEKIPVLQDSDFYVNMYIERLRRW